MKYPHELMSAEVRLIEISGATSNSIYEGGIIKWEGQY